jgi:hypothetical protein
MQEVFITSLCKKFVLRSSFGGRFLVAYRCTLCHEADGGRFEHLH